MITGLLAYTGMVRENYPDLAIPQATVSVLWPGAAPAQMEEEITRPLEDEIRAQAGIRSFQSSSQSSFTLITVQFEADIAIADAMARLRTNVAAAAARFPRGPERPVIEQVSVNDLPIMTIAVSGGHDQHRLEQATARRKRLLETDAGVRRINLQGDRGEAVHILLDSARLRALGLSPVDVREAVRIANQDLSWGQFEDVDGTLPLYLDGRFSSLAQIEALVVGRVGDTPVRLGDVASVDRGLRADRGETRVSAGGAAFRPAITLSVLKRPETDTIATIDRVRGRLDALADDPTWPRDVEVFVASDEGEIIRASFNEVQSNLAQGVAAVFAVLLLALTWRAALVAAVALSVTLLGALAAIGLVGFTLNTLVMLGMVIALGILVDVFILVMEGMHEGTSVRGERFEEAAVATARTFFLPALAGQATTILAMAPLMLMGGVDGKFIRLIPLTAITCLILSLIVAFVVCIPLSRALLARPSGAHAPTRVDRLTERAASALTRFLQRGPVRSRAWAGATVGLAALTFAAALVLADGLDSIVYPKEDHRSLGITVELRPDATLAEARAVGDRVGAALRDRPELASVFVHVGEISPYALPAIEDYLTPLDSANLVGVSARFIEQAARDRLAFEYLPEIRAALDAALADTPGVTVRLTPDLGGATAGAPIAIQATGPDLQRLRAIADDLSRGLAKIPGVTDVHDTLGPFRTELRYTADPEALSFYSLTEADLLEQVRIAMQDDKIGSFAQPGTAPDLDLHLGTGFVSRAGEIGGPMAIHELETISVVNDAGLTTPLASLVEVEPRAVPGAILHEGGQRSVTLRANLEDGTTPAQAMAAFAPVLAAQRATWPEGYSAGIGGETAAATETFTRTRDALILALSLVFAVMALLFQSLSQPLIILAMVPLSLTGVFLGFVALNIAISFAAMIGVVVLIGIVVNDAIVMVEVINKRRAAGMDPRAAACHGAADRLRPILTTSVTTVIGLTPLALSSPAWYPLCMAVILGLSVATVLALVVIPALYVLVTGPGRAAAVEALA